MDEKGTCFHFRCLSNGQGCNLGINIRQITGGPDEGWGSRIPCHRFACVIDGKPVERAKCDLYLDAPEPTADQLAAEEAEWEERVVEIARKMRAVGPLVGRIKRTNRGRSNHGEEPCPACGVGQLSWSFVGCNSLVEIACSDDNCVQSYRIEGRDDAAEGT